MRTRRPRARLVLCRRALSPPCRSPRISSIPQVQTIQRVSCRSLMARHWRDGTATLPSGASRTPPSLGRARLRRWSARTFLIWRGGVLRDFELKVEFKMNGVNTGIQVRSMEMPTAGKWVLKGYQADADFGDRFTGNIHEERGRNVIVS